NSTGDYRGFLLENIDFPLDLAFNSCASLYVNNVEINGLRLEFDLEIYERTPSFDLEEPVAACIPSGKEFQLLNGSVNITPEDIDKGSSDNCGIASMDLSQSTFTTPGEYEIE